MSNDGIERAPKLLELTANTLGIAAFIFSIKEEIDKAIRSLSLP